MALSPRKRQLEVVSPSLLNNIDIHPVTCQFSLGMDESWDPNILLGDNIESLAGPSAKRKKSLSLSLKKPGKEKQRSLQHASMKLSVLLVMVPTINQQKDLFLKTPENVPSEQ